MYKCTANPTHIDQLDFKNITMASVIIIGAGISGLCNAVAVAEHFDRIILIEKDDVLGSRVSEESIEASARRRGGIQQFIFPHVLLSGGAQALEKLLPGILDEFERRGGTKLDVGSGSHTFDYGGVYPKETMKIDAYAMSRRLLNETLQDMAIERLGNKLEVKSNAKVSSLIWTKECLEIRNADAAKSVECCQAKPDVWGVRLSTGEVLISDLVIVADGRRSQLPRWLNEGNYCMPKAEKVDCKTIYAAGWFVLPADYNYDEEPSVLTVMDRPRSARTGIAIRAENKMLQVLLAGLSGDHCPLNIEGFLEYSKSLPDRSIFELLERCELKGPIRRFAGLPNFMPGYHKMMLPQGLFVVGDAFLRFNPIYGQGQSVASMQALALQQLLIRCLNRIDDKDKKIIRMRNIGRKVHSKMFQISSVAWGMATSADFRWEDRIDSKRSEPVVLIEGHVKRPPKLLKRYADALSIAGHRDPKIYSASAKVLHLVRPPSDLFGVQLLFRVLWSAHREKTLDRHQKRHFMNDKSRTENTVAYN